MSRLDEISWQRKKSHTKLMQLNSKVYQLFLDMENAAFSDGALEGKLKELIAVGISVVINCESGIQYHITRAVDKGATQEEVLEAVEVGIEMGGGPATVSARLALEVMDKLFEK